MNISKSAWSLCFFIISRLVAVAPGKLLSCIHIGLNGWQSSFLHVPFAFKSIDFKQGVVKALIEGKNMRKLVLKVSQSEGENSSVCSKVFSLLRFGSTVDFFVGDSNVKHVSWWKTRLGHECCLGFGAWEVLNYPSILEAVSSLWSLCQELHHKLVIDASTFLLHSFSKSLALCAVSTNILFNDLIHL